MRHQPGRGGQGIGQDPRTDGALTRDNQMLTETVRRRFAECPSVDSLFLAAHPEWRDQIEQVLRAVHDKPSALVDEGAWRNDSVHHVVESMVDVQAPVLVHGGVRPLVSEEGSSGG